ncbi:MAG TPA: DNA translocase FtsK 4TM domain-containing protein [Pseudomonadales bacterium]|nr:DNA translocase FtsK 4TM domain-containing protein [Pseudomonadales bacterium]
MSDVNVSGVSRRLTEGLLIATVALCAFVTIALMTYYGGDPGYNTTGTGGAIRNATGSAGAWLSDVLFSLFGYSAYLFPGLLALRAVLIFREKFDPETFHRHAILMRSLGFMLVIIATTCLSALQAGSANSELPYGFGGFFGEQLALWSLGNFGLLGSRLIMVTAFLFGLTIFTDISWFRLMEWLGRRVMIASERLAHWWTLRRKRQQEKAEVEAVQAKRKAVLDRQTEEVKKRLPPKIAPPVQKVEVSERVEKEKQATLFSAEVEGELPAIGLLNGKHASSDQGYSEETLQAMSRLLELKLRDFGIEAEVVEVLPGPVITRFEIQPAAGVKVSRISNLAKDLARSLAVISVRVVEVVPGKSVVGIEIPNENRQVVAFSEVIASKAYEDSRSALTLALGHDISGEPVVVDLAKMPHLLVAGTTGSGKSVGVNSMLLSLLFKSTPEQVRLLLVDPKMLELSIYDGIPHLLAPVVTDMKDAANGLRWCVGEMERRYKLMAALGVRNLAGYNRKVADAIKAGEPVKDPLWKPAEHFEPGFDVAPAPDLEELPAIVVVIDEFADMMMIVGKKVEELIARIAQKARAAGIHLILATQRPSVDVITGLIKANVPTRIAFQVSSKIDSRTILDQGGAEQLLGQGDMLYLPPGSGVPIRVHGAFVADEEVHRVVDDWKKRGTPNFIEDILEGGSSSVPIPGFSSDDDDGSDPEADALYDEAVRYVTESRRASISSVQRKLRIGYNRAARLIETMEAAGVVSEMGHNGSREVLAPPPME